MISIINYTRIRFFSSFTLVAAVIFLLLFSAKAQEMPAEMPDSPAVVQDEKASTADFDAAFQQMIADPANVDSTLNYAKIAVNLGNYEAAIPPLERILMFNPNLPKIKLELGVLYYRLDSFKMAKSYFQDTVKSKDASEEMRASAQEYLQKIKG